MGYSRLGLVGAAVLLALSAGLITGCNDNKKTRATDQRIEQPSRTNTNAGRIETERVEIETMGEPDDPDDLDENSRVRVIERDRTVY